MRDFLENNKNNGIAFLVICLILLTTLVSVLALYSPFSYLTFIINGGQINTSDGHYGDSRCDLFEGEWISDPKGERYTNATCPTFPSSKNCLSHGRLDKEFMHWRWKPNKCGLLRFEPRTFFNIMRAKKLAFIGDSIARNQVESLVCLLSQEETPIDVYKDFKDRSRTWFFPRNNFTIMVLWTRFLVKSVEKEGGKFDLHLDQVDEKWAQNVSQGLVDYAIVSDSQWYFKKNYLYEDAKLIGCVYCNETNVEEFVVGFAIGRALQTTLRHINNCEKCKKMKTIVRTISPSHFEGGTWKDGGNCERTRPYNKTQAENLLITGTKNDEEWEVRQIQMAEITRARTESMESSGRTRVHAMDITKVMFMRPDGHPGPHWRDKKKKGFNDCVHWCMPGPIDVWNDLLLALVKRIS